MYAGHSSMRKFQCPLRWAGRCNIAVRAMLRDGTQFQCPLRWAGRCNEPSRAEKASNDQVSVPSSLGREMQLTPVFYQPSQGRQFQCPLRWAGRCNPEENRQVQPKIVSVPSSLGREMQHACGQAGRHTSASFSALFVGQGDATRHWRPRSLGPQTVSVPSSLGREMQQYDTNADAIRHLSFSALFVGQGDATSIFGRPQGARRKFQCPLRWAGRCNCRLCQSRTAHGVSVPSSLGREMQPNLAISHKQSTKVFQCPLRWAGRCNVNGGVVEHGTQVFQCPLRWAGRCNPVSNHSSTTFLHCFSALFVGQGDATGLLFPAQSG